MNFDTKHILKWGIPGWYLIINIVVAVSSLIGYEWITDSGYLTPSIIITLAGVPLGYVIYQPYFFVSTLMYENKGNQWNILLFKMSDETKRLFLSNRYGYFLNNIHGYGSLISAVIISLIYLIVLAFIHEFNTEIFMLIIMNIVLVVIVSFNFKHYQKNFENFINQIIRELKKDINR
ncbi:hypothetical protein AB4Y30_11515 [Ornithinibacillus sp. 4-3]|uniref:Uncharacterized protein n=1 Tax=Ornithinibacillus sp. 4-3 TaxID=3231488 RepID=A0AB39HLU5_9BACI